MTALHGLKVLDLTRLLPGPFATMVLADLGAQVDKVEDTGAGDYLRAAPPAVGGMGAGYRILNRGKRSLALDLKRPEGAALLLRLARSYDVVFEQFRPGVMDRLGVSHARLLEENPRLVVCALTGYGQDGPLRDRAGHDLNYLARAGILGLMGPADGPPQLPSFQLADVSGGLYAVIGILAALRARDTTGRGAVVDISMLESVIGFAALPLARLLAGELPARGAEYLTGGIAAYGCYETKDGGAVTLGALEPKFLAAFLGAVGMEVDLMLLVPGDHQATYQQRLRDLFRTRTRAEWEALGREHDCCLEPVLRPDELLTDPQLTARRAFVTTDAAGEKLGHFRTPVTPRDFTPAPAPAQGEQGERILLEAGLTPEEIATLRQANVVR